MSTWGPKISHGVSAGGFGLSSLCVDTPAGGVGLLAELAAARCMYARSVLRQVRALVGSNILRHHNQQQVIIYKPVRVP